MEQREQKMIYMVENKKKEREDREKEKKLQMDKKLKEN